MFIIIGGFSHENLDCWHFLKMKDLTRGWEPSSFLAVCPYKAEDQLSFITA